MRWASVRAIRAAARIAGWDGKPYVPREPILGGTRRVSPESPQRIEAAKRSRRRWVQKQRELRAEGGVR